MIELSDNFRRLATANGREIECKILLGENAVLTDNEIIEFDFDDVIHPDYLTLGTTCSNRFHFRAVYGNDVALDVVVKPFVRFLSSSGGEDSEWCPLGIFYITRRYMRENRISITCYDRMYQLDGLFTKTELFPCTATVLFRKICEEYGIESNFLPRNDMLSAAPSEATVRDVVGFIAALNGGNAKFGRDGKLEIKKLSSVLDAIVEKNCMSVSINQDYGTLLALEINRGTDTISLGTAGLLSTVQLFDPFFTPNTAQRLLDSFYGFNFYGATLRTQAMPWFESGDVVTFQHGTKLKTLVLSEIDYHYNGSFTAEIFSRSKNPIEEYVYLSDLEERINAIEQKLAMTCYKYTNANEITINTSQAEIAVIDFEAYEKAFVQFDMTLTVLAASDCECVFAYYLNNGAKLISPKKHIHAGCSELLHLYFLDDSLESGKNILSVKAMVSSGTARIAKNQLLATITGQRLKGNIGNTSPRAILSEEIPSVSISQKTITINNFSESTGFNSSHIRSRFTDEMGLVSISQQPITTDGISINITAL